MQRKVRLQLSGCPREFPKKIPGTFQVFKGIGIKNFRVKLKGIKLTNKTKEG